MTVPCDRDRGFTLVEVIVAVAIFGIVVMSTGLLIVQAVRAQGAAERRDIASQWAHGLLARAYQSTWNTLGFYSNDGSSVVGRNGEQTVRLTGTRPSTQTNDPLLPTKTTTIKGVTLTSTVDITWADQPTTKRVRIKTEWAAVPAGSGNCTPNTNCVWVETTRTANAQEQAPDQAAATVNQAADSGCDQPTGSAFCTLYVTIGQVVSGAPNYTQQVPVRFLATTRKPAGSVQATYPITDPKTDAAQGTQTVNLAPSGSSGLLYDATVYANPKIWQTEFDTVVTFRATGTSGSPTAQYRVKWNTTNYDQIQMSDFKLLTGRTRNGQKYICYNPHSPNSNSAFHGSYAYEYKINGFTHKGSTFLSTQPGTNAARISDTFRGYRVDELTETYANWRNGGRADDAAQITTTSSTAGFSSVRTSNTTNDTIKYSRSITGSYGTSTSPGQSVNPLTVDYTTRRGADNGFGGVRVDVSSYAQPSQTVYEAVRACVAGHYETFQYTRWITDYQLRSYVYWQETGYWSWTGLEWVWVVTGGYWATYYYYVSTGQHREVYTQTNYICEVPGYLLQPKAWNYDVCPDEITPTTPIYEQRQYACPGGPGSFGNGGNARCRDYYEARGNKFFDIGFGTPPPQPPQNW